MPDSPFNNSNLFSNHYLKRLVQKNPEWSDPDGLDQVFEVLKEKLTDSSIEVFKTIGEPELEDALIKPRLKMLCHHFGVQVPVCGGRYKPDYGFLQDEGSRDEAYLHRENFYAKAIAVGDAKRWTVSLDKNQEKAKGQFEMINPSFQIDTYLRETAPKGAQSRSRLALTAMGTSAPPPSRYPEVQQMYFSSQSD
ncbi:MAG TPA: hypothetical protein HA349_03365 [Methanotrichaceae archaeon]|nr:hypothetical protein [Methanotrichaceae archaeon]